MVGETEGKNRTERMNGADIHIIGLAYERLSKETKTILATLLEQDGYTRLSVLSVDEMAGFLKTQKIWEVIKGYYDEHLQEECLHELAKVIVSLKKIKKCNCVYASDCHGIEMIKAPSGKEWAIGGTDTEDRWKFCPWCGGII